MRLFPSGLFLTLVLSSAVCRSATTTESKPAPARTSLQDDSAVKVVTPDVSETMSPSYPARESELPVTNVRDFGATHRRRGEWTLEARGGVIGGYLLKSDDSEATGAIGAQAVWTPAPERAWDFSADATDSRLVAVAAGRRFIFDSEYVGGAYWKLAVSQTLEANSFFGTLVELQRVKGWAGVGSSDLFDLDRRLVAELQVGYGLAGIGYRLHVGWAFDL